MKYIGLLGLNLIVGFITGRLGFPLWVTGVASFIIALVYMKLTNFYE